MYPTIMPPAATPNTAPPTDLTPAVLADLGITITDHEDLTSALAELGIADVAALFAEELEGETAEERAAREAAAEDILDDRLTDRLPEITDEDEDDDAREWFTC